MSGFSNPVVGGQGTLIRDLIKSPNFLSNVRGWQISRDGSAQFNNLTIRGAFNGTNFVLNSSGLFFYSGNPATGNLIESITDAAGNDGLPAGGNAFLQGNTSYLFAAGVFTAVNMNGGVISWYESASASGPWTLFSAIGFAWNNVTGGSLLLQAGNQVKLGQAGNAIWDEINQKLNLPAAGGPFVTGETWHVMPAFGAGFSHGTPAPSYRLNADNTVSLTGQVNVTAGTTSGTVVTLPSSAYFPLSVKTFPVPIGAGTPATSGSARVNIGTIGNIVLAGGPTVAAYTFSLDGIRYPLDI
jgi:hypothetical protein